MLGEAEAERLPSHTAAEPPRHVRRLPFGIDDVSRVEMYTYTYSSAPTEVRRTIVNDKPEMTLILDYFRDLPLFAPDRDLERVDGADADGFRFILRDGSTYEVTQLFRGGARGSVLVWPDGTIRQLEHGSPFSYGGVVVDPADRPAAVIA